MAGDGVALGAGRGMKREERPERPERPERLAHLAGLARLALWWEAAWPALWPATATLGVFVAVTLAGLWRIVPGWLHVALLAGFAVALAAALALAVRSLRWPRRAAGHRRLESESGLAHRPLTAIDDEIAGDRGDPWSRALWRAHKARLAAATRRLRVGWPRGGLAERDPFGLRAVVGLVLVIGIAIGGADAETRFARVLEPEFSATAVEPAILEAWISPPDYTGAAPLYLEPGDHRAAAALAVPVGSEIIVAVKGGAGRPTLVDDETAVAFDHIGEREFQLRTVIAAGRALVVTQEASVLGAWSLRLIPDQPPSVAFVDPPRPTARDSLRVHHQAADDYGVESVVLEIVRGEEPALSIPIPLVPSRRSSDAVSHHSLTSHRWAGIEVTLQLIATDGIGQTGASATTTLTLPRRIFINPVARAIIEQRRRLTTYPGHREPEFRAPAGREPRSREQVARALEAIANLHDQYGDDTAVFLNLQSAAKRLRYDDTAEAVDAVADQLWDTALRAEDGGLGLAEADLRRAEQALMEALARDASDDEIAALTDRLERALNRFLEALREQAEQLARRGELAPIDPGAMTLSDQQLQSMLDRIRELGQTGARERARQLLSQLQEMLENLRPGASQMARPRDGEDARRMLNQLGDLTRRQQELLDLTFRRAQRGQAERVEDGGQSSAAQQEALRRLLGDIMAQLGDLDSPIPGPLGQAEQAMRAARDFLAESDDQGAVRPQTDALEQLRRGAGQLLAEMLDRLGDQPGRRGQGQVGLGEDPLGRGMGEEGGLFLDGDVEIPDRAAMKRAREIIDELHRRVGDRRRSREERDYLERLLRRF